LVERVKGPTKYRAWEFGGKKLITPGKPGIKKGSFPGIRIWNLEEIPKASQLRNQLKIPKMGLWNKLEKMEKPMPNLLTWEGNQ